MALLAGAGLMIPYAWALANRWLARGAATAAFAPAIPDSTASALGALRGAWLQAFYLFTGAGTSSLAGLTAASSFAWRVTGDCLRSRSALLIGGWARSHRSLGARRLACPRRPPSAGVDGRPGRGAQPGRDTGGHAVLDGAAPAAGALPGAGAGGRRDLAGAAGLAACGRGRHGRGGLCGGVVLGRQLRRAAAGCGCGGRRSSVRRAARTLAAGADRNARVGGSTWEPRKSASPWMAWIRATTASRRPWRC